MTEVSGPRREGLVEDVSRARRLEWLGLAYLCSTVTILVFVMSGSQALKTEFVGDALSMIAPILFLVGDRVSAREPSETYPFGYERAVAAGYLGAALALLATGAYLCGDSARKLISREHPIIGGVSVFGHVVGSAGSPFRRCCGARFRPTSSAGRSGGWRRRSTTRS